MENGGVKVLPPVPRPLAWSVIQVEAMTTYIRVCRRDGWQVWDPGRCWAVRAMYVSIAPVMCCATGGINPDVFAHSF